MTAFVGTVALTERNLLRMRRNPSSVAGAIVFPLLFLGLFHTVLNRTMSALGIDYAQYLPPAVVAQAMFFAAMSSAFYLTDDRTSGLFDRYRSLPIGRATPLVARACADLARASVSLGVVMAASFGIGFRFEAGALAGVGFVLQALGFAVVLILGCGLVGLTARDASAAVAAVQMPYLPLLMLSSAFVPVSSFPDWMEPVVRNSPVTAVVDSLRVLGAGGPTASKVLVSAAWCVGLSALFVLVGARKVASVGRVPGGGS